MPVCGDALVCPRRNDEVDTTAAEDGAVGARSSAYGRDLLLRHREQPVGFHKSA
jgi:hypothetical protein